MRKEIKLASPRRSKVKKYTHNAVKIYVIVKRFQNIRVIATKQRISRLKGRGSFRVEKGRNGKHHKDVN
jgi:hypothetical protein